MVNIHLFSDHCRPKYSDCWLCFLNKISRWHGQQDWHIQPCHFCKASWCPVLCGSASNFHRSHPPIWGRNCHRGKVTQGVAELWRWSWKASCRIRYFSLEPSFRCYSGKSDYCHHNRKGKLLPTHGMVICVQKCWYWSHILPRSGWYALGLTEVFFIDLQGVITKTDADGGFDIKGFIQSAK